MSQGNLTLDAESLYAELLQGVRRLLTAQTRLVGITPRVGLGWPHVCSRT